MHSYTLLCGKFGRKYDLVKPKTLPTHSGMGEPIFQSNRKFSEIMAYVLVGTYYLNVQWASGKEAKAL